MFAPKHYFDGTLSRTVFIVREMRKNVEVLMLDSSVKLVVRSMPKHMIVTHMRDIDYGVRQERKMKASLRRLAKKKGTSKKAREAVKVVVS